MRPNVPPGYQASRQSMRSSTVDTRVMKPTITRKAKHHSVRSNMTAIRSAQQSSRIHGAKPAPSSPSKPSSSRRTHSSRNNRSSSGKDEGRRRATSESRRRRAKREKSATRREYYSDYSDDDESSSEEYSESSDSYASEGDMATQLDDRGMIVNASDLSECWSKVSIESDEESAFQRYAKKVEEKERNQNGFFFLGSQESVSLPSLDTKAQTTYTLADTTYTDTYATSTRADTYTEADTTTHADTYTEADTYTRDDDTYTEAYTEADTYTRDDTYTEADSQTYASTHYGRSESDDASEAESYYTHSDDSGIHGADTYYTTRTQRTDAVQGNMWMCGAGQADDDTLDAQSYGGLRNNEVLIASSRTIATFETREPKESWRGARDSRHSPRETKDQYGRLISGNQKTQKPKRSNDIKKWNQPQNSQKVQNAPKPLPPTKTARSKRASAGTMKLEKIEESQNEGTHQSILALPLQWWYGKTKEDEKQRKRESRERMENAKRDLLVKPHLHVDGKRGYDGSLTLDARVRKDAEEGAWSSGNPPTVDLDGRVKKATEPEILNGKKKNQPPSEPTTAPPSAFAPKETQKIDVWTDGDTEVESVVPDFSGQCKIEAFGDSRAVNQHLGDPIVNITTEGDDDQHEEVPEPVSSDKESSIEQQEEERGPTLHEEMQDAAFDTVWVAPSAMSRMSFESQQTLPTVNTTHQSEATKEQQPPKLVDDDKSMSSLPKVQPQHRKNSSVSNLINAFEKNLVSATPADGQSQNRARADWRSPGPLVAPVVPAPAWIASAHNDDQEVREESPREQMTMDPEQMKNQQRCLFDSDDERTEVTTDEPTSTMLQLDGNGQVSAGHNVALDSSVLSMEKSGGKVAADPFQAFDTAALPFFHADPEPVQPVAAATTHTRGQFVKNKEQKEEQKETAFSTTKNNDVEYFGQFKRETLQSSEPSKTTLAKIPFKPRRRRNNNATAAAAAAGKVKSFLSSFPRRNHQKNNALQSYHQLDDNDSYRNWGTGSTVASKVHGDLGDDDDGDDYDHGMTREGNRNDAPHDDALVRDAMETINGTEQLMRDADSFFAAGSFYEALEDGFSVD